MIVILCLDDRNGMLFHQRRQSRDKRLLENVFDLCVGKNIYVNEYSNQMFLSYGFTTQIQDPHFLVNADQGEYCFIEDDQFLAFFNKIEKLVIYRWNRHYPSDLFFGFKDFTGFTLIETLNFPGSSHKQITREIYER